ncbi:MAG: NCS2 family permease [Actinomycetales bacterium]|jgi:adenine/guanine/hypoxanthine permease|uniref:NCS2 family permease n=1 Tax=Thermobispora bispora TaxID=2006 RepID=UPI00197FD39F|nr:NCS2 family permease [Thermobispora bispora]MBO2475795.1 permease [Actinomycetales bacterium]MDI9581601.1 NCS2 family permease [Thermobispora sp.]QSI46440.1 NCS2 family permease [Thermobispora bispora]QSI49546.1 NCS2 family permease [Thermobispora bispora]
MGCHSSRVTSTDSANTAKSAPTGFLDRYFSITARGSTIGQEIRGGLATFFTMAYIVVLNPLIIGTVADATGEYLGDGSSPNLPLIAAATSFVAGIFTIAMGVFGRVPFAIATGLGLNAFLAFGVASQMSWEDAMGLVVLEGIIITILVLTGFRTAVFRAIPPELKTAISVGIGLFIALIGFVDAGFVRRVPDAAGTTVPVQLGSLGTGSLTGWPTLVFVIGLLGTAFLVARKVKGAILIGILGSTVLAIIVEAIAKLGPQVVDGKTVNPDAWSLNVPTLPSSLIELPDLSLLGQFSLFGGFAKVGGLAAVMLVFTLMLADFFDTMGTIVGVGRQAGLVKPDGNLERTREILLVDSLAAAAGGAASVSSNTTYVESAAGVGEGARTGLASVVTGVLFLLSMFLAPLTEVVPFEAATPALVIVGFLMMTQVKEIDFSNFEVAIPAFLTIVLMPFTYSITVGIGAGFISYVFIKAVRGKAREISFLLWLVAGLFVIYFAMEPIRSLLGV